MTPRGGFVRDPRWPRWTSGPGAGGVWKEGPEDFVVEEVPELEPTGAGEHQWLRVQKIGRTTPEVAELLAVAAGVGPEAVGYAGMKDRDARTIQDFTVMGGQDVGALPPGVRVLARGRTDRKLRVGQLAGNRFTLRIRGGDLSRAQERASRVAATGLPNFYGAQRVGGEAPRSGRAVLLGGGPRLSHPQLKFALSAYQSLLFNEVLVARGARRLDGDLLDEHGIPTGPMYGHAMRWPEGEARLLEERVVGRERLPPDAWRRFPKLTQGTRRALWVTVSPEIEPQPDGFLLRFVLPAGSYATVLLEELL